MTDRVAIAGVGTTPYARDRGQSELAMVVHACRAAIRDAGLTAADIDGLAGSWVPTELVQSALGLPATSWYLNIRIPPFHLQVINAVNAVLAGACETVLVYHSQFRSAGSSRSAAADPFRATARVLPLTPPSPFPDTIFAIPCYSTWTGRYLYDYGAKREHLGAIAINSRSHAAANEHALLRDPFTMEDYLAAPMVRDPLTRFDMDYPIDGADAIVVTTAQRAADGPHRPVLVHATAMGQTAHTIEEDLPDLAHTGQQVARDRLWARSELTLGDVDLFYPYEGFTIMALTWLESAGWCGPGEGGPFVEDHWDQATQRIRIDGRVLVNTHGGSLSEGGSQGAGHVREAVLQLRGAAGARQAEHARTALIAGGGFFFNAGLILLRT